MEEISILQNSRRTRIGVLDAVKVLAEKHRRIGSDLDGLIRDLNMAIMVEVQADAEVQIRAWAIA